MFNRASALPTLAILVTILTLILTSTSFAQHHPPAPGQLTPQNYNPYGAPYQPAQPTPIIITPSTPYGTTTNTMIHNPDGSITLIFQQGNDVWVVK